MSATPHKRGRHFPSDARGAVKSYHAFVAQEAEPSHHADEKGHPYVSYDLQPYARNELQPATRMRCVTLNFVLRGSNEELLKVLDKRRPLVVEFRGAALMQAMAVSAHEPESHAGRFALGFLVAINLRDSHISGVAPGVGDVGLQVLAKEAVFNEARGKIEASDRPRQWTAHLPQTQHSVMRDLGDKGGVPTPAAYAVKISPAVQQHFGPGQHQIYRSHAAINSRVMQHLDAGAFGLDNYIITRDRTGGLFVRCPVPVDHTPPLYVCPDSLSWYVCHATGPRYQAKDFLRKLDHPLKVHTRRHEIDRYEQALAAGAEFVPRSHLPALNAREDARSQETLDEENVDILPVTGADVTLAYNLFRHEVLRLNRGIVDFTQGVRVEFTPLNPRLWIDHLRKNNTVAVISVTLDLVYVPLLSWLDTEVGTQVGETVELTEAEETEVAEASAQAEAKLEDEEAQH